MTNAGSFMDVFGSAVVVVLAIAAGPVVMYGIGYAFSLGYHRGKREFIARIMRDSTKKERGHG